MKLTKLFVGLGIMAISAGVIIPASLTIENKEPIHAVAATAPSTLEPSINTMRIWARRGSSTYWFQGDEIMVVHNHSDQVQYKMNQYDNKPDGVNSESFYYVDIPVNTTGFNFCRMDPTTHEIWNWSHDIKISDISDITTITTQAFYLNVDSYGKTNWSQGIPTPHDYFFAKWLEGFSTCSSSSLNGYNAYQGLVNGLYSKLSDTFKNSFRTVQISDYAYDANNSGYTSDKNVWTSAGDKWDALGSYYASNASKGLFKSNNLGFLANGNDNRLLQNIIIPLVGCVSLAILVVILNKKKTKKHN